MQLRKEQKMQPLPLPAAKPPKRLGPSSPLQLDDEERVNVGGCDRNWSRLAFASCQWLTLHHRLNLSVYICILCKWNQIVTPLPSKVSWPYFQGGSIFQFSTESAIMFVGKLGLQLYSSLATLHLSCVVLMRGKEVCLRKCHVSRCPLSDIQIHTAHNDFFYLA